MKDSRRVISIKSRKSKKPHKKSDDDYIAEFMAFESCAPCQIDRSLSSSGLTNSSNIGNRVATTVEDDIQRWLDKKIICLGDPKEKKEAYFNKLKRLVADETSHKIREYSRNQQFGQLDKPLNQVTFTLSTRRKLNLSIPENTPLTNSSLTPEDNLSNEPMMPFKTIISQFDHYIYK